MENLEIIFLLLGLVALLAIFSDRYRFPLPIVLVVVGLAVSFIPGLPVIVLDPEVVFLLFLPPLLYSAAWYTDWREFRENLRPILLAGVGLVIFTTVVVAWAARTIVPSLSWAEAFLLGAIVSPPDAVAATSVTKGLGIHKRIIAIMEGESLINDAAGLVAYRYALAAVLTGTFGIWEAGLQFLWVASAGVALGVAVGYLMLFVHKHLTNNPVIETSLTLLSPYVSYLLAEHWHVSGVLAVVAQGLFLTGRASGVFGTQSRLHTYAVWDVLVFILNGAVFILIGLQLKYVLREISSYSLLELMGYGLAVSLIVIIVRFVWVYPAAYLPRLFSKRIREREYFEHGYVFLFAWSGMRGVVSMAAALALPLTVNGTQPFPNRSLILFLTFVVILVTLVIQGLTLRPIIKWLRIKPYSVMEEEFKTRATLANALIAHIEENLSFGEVSDQVLAQIKSKYELKAQRLNSTDISGHQTDSPSEIFNQIVTTQLQLIGQERKLLHQLRKEHKAGDEIVRKIEHELDLEEARLRAELYEH